MKKVIAIVGCFLVVVSMLLASGHTLIESQHVVMAFPPAEAVAGTEDYVSMKDWSHLTVILSYDNEGSTVTGATVTLKQATTVAGAGEKALEFDYVYANTNTASSDAFTKTTVTSDTFDSSTGGDLNGIYVIEIEASDLDVANVFDCVRVDLTGNVNNIISGTYILSRGRYLGGTPVRSAITD